MPSCCCWVDTSSRYVIATRCSTKGQWGRLTTCGNSQNIETLSKLLMLYTWWPLITAVRGTFYRRRLWGYTTKINHYRLRSFSTLQIPRASLDVQQSAHGGTPAAAITGVVHQNLRVLYLTILESAGPCFWSTWWLQVLFHENVLSYCTR